MSRGVVDCLEIEPEYEIRDGILYVSAGDWGMCMPLRIAKRSNLKLARVIAEYEGRSAEIIPMRSHAAS